MENCCNTGAVSGEGDLGGIVGLNDGGTVTNCYYLDILTEDTTSTPKTADQFASGEVTYLLQKGQRPQVWGQTVGTGYPELTDNEDEKVFKITGEVEGQESVVWYSNNKATLPTDPEKAGYTFEGWSTDEARTEADFREGSAVNDDMTVYAVFKEISSAPSTTVDRPVTPIPTAARQRWL